MRVLISGGGTGGHIFPAVAVAQALRRNDSQGSILYVGRQGGPEAGLARAQGLETRLILAAGFDRDRLHRNWRLPLVLPAAFWQATRAVHAFRPDVMLGTGGYVAAPVVAAARLQGVPVVLQEQNVRPGWATRLAVPTAWAIAVGFEETVRRLRAARVVVTGNPVRVPFAEPAPAPQGPHRILLMGGSQGARHLNEVLVAALPRLLAPPDRVVVHLTGQRDFEAMRVATQTLDPLLGSRYRLEAFREDMDALLRASDLVIARAGGMTIAEATALGRPLMLVPGTFGGGHQTENAEATERAGAAMVIRDREFTADRLVHEVEALTTQPARFDRLCRGSLAFGRPHAADAVVELLRQAAA
jgi:UDP-N-acetylglucosamine--N-acetylmuramyl-(pentapeptide) pyrophosphoryl-undecaprenol N-acetylglucosamine transferase